MQQKTITSYMTSLLAVVAVGGVLYGGLLNVAAVEEADEAAYRGAHACLAIVTGSQPATDGAIFQCDNGRWTQRQIRGHLASHVTPPHARAAAASAPVQPGNAGPRPGHAG